MFYWRDGMFNSSLEGLLWTCYLNLNKLFTSNLCWCVELLLTLRLWTWIHLLPHHPAAAIRPLRSLKYVISTLHDICVLWKTVRSRVYLVDLYDGGFKTMIDRNIWLRLSSRFLRGHGVFRFWNWIRHLLTNLFYYKANRKYLKMLTQPIQNIID